MASGQSGTIARQVQRLFGGGSVAGLAEGQLLDRFIKNRDESAFEAIIARHGPMVLGVCRRVLHDPRDAEDAFQVTFLILVKKAGGIRDREQLGPWLHGVAQRVALRARFVAARSLERERTGVDVEETAVELLGETDRREFRAVLDEELGRLPDKYRSPIVLCYLEGLTHEEAAERLRWPVGTVRSRMAWARERLRGRLARRGLALPSALLLSALASETTAAPVPSALLESTLKAAMGLAAAKGATAGIVSASVASLMGEVIKVMYYHKLKSFCFGVIAVGAVTGGAVVANLAPTPGPVSPQGSSNGQAGTRADNDDDQLAEINDEIKRLENRLQTAKKKRQEILTKLGRIGSGSTVSTGPTGTSGSTTASGTSGSFTITSSASAGSSGSSSGIGTGSGSGSGLGAPGGFSITSSGPAPASGVSGGSRATSGGLGRSSSGSISTSNSSVKAGGSMTVNGLTTATGGAPATGSGSTSVSRNGVSTGSSSAATDHGVSASNGTIVAVVTPDGDRVAVHKEGGGTKVYRVPKGVRANPMVSDAFVALQMRGDSIPEVTVYDVAREKWATFELKEPAHGVISTAVTPPVFAFQIGRSLGAYSSQTGKWEVVDLPEETKSSMIVNANVITLTTNKGLYVLDPAKGAWEVTDLSDEKNEK